MDEEGTSGVMADRKDPIFRVMKHSENNSNYLNYI